MDNFAIKLEKVSKSFKLPHEKNATLKGALINFARRGYEIQRVFTDLSLTVSKGEFLGILGRNGSGKSTLLKTLSGIYTPDSGQIIINGKLTPFIELGVGFNPELSGRDNVYLNGALLGFSRKEIDVIYNEIVQFAELERFMDQKLKNYSSGMQVRLAFSIAIRANTDILVLDEVLAVGDEAFQRKCYDYFNELKAKGKTVILVTHDMNAVQSFCTRAIVLSEGKIIYDGDTTSAASVYRGLNLKSSESSIEKKNKKRSARNAEHIKGIAGITTLGSDGKEKTLFKAKELIMITCEVQLSDISLDYNLYLKFNNPGGVTISAINIDLGKETLSKVGKKKTYEIKWKLPGIYNDGSFLISAFLTDAKTGSVYAKQEEAYEFGIQGWNTPNILIHPSDSYSIE
jgi:ABC-2 type transport system ATP-binding protein